jgi:cell division protein FtsQ
MAGMVSVSRTDLRVKRHKLRRQRQMKIIQAIWRIFAVSSLLGGLLWVASQPMWVLETPKQIEIKSGLRSLSPEAIQKVLVLSYPQSLWRIEPSLIAESLTKQPIIAKASVTRRLFPPGLIIDIQERVPVAVAQSHHQANLTSDANIASSTGLLDANGIWMNQEKYTLLNPTVKLPSLIVIGSFEQYRSYWNQLYQSVSQSSVKIMEIDCQDPTNIIMKTELGYVHLGAVSPQISEQIKVLAQMSHLPTQLNPNQIEYIDLKNPESPLVQMNQKTVKSNSQTR